MSVREIRFERLSVIITLTFGCGYLSIFAKMSCQSVPCCKDKSNYNSPHLNQSKRYMMNTLFNNLANSLKDYILLLTRVVMC